MRNRKQYINIRISRNKTVFCSEFVEKFAAMTITNLLVLSVFATVLVSGVAIVKRELNVHGDYHGFNAIDFSSFKLPLPPAYSTISFVQSHHSKPVSYSGFTNHGRGHHDPGYAIEFRSEGFHHPPHGYHHHYY